LGGPHDVRRELTEYFREELAASLDIDEQRELVDAVIEEIQHAEFVTSIALVLRSAIEL
jgi:hypothetical protein